MRFPCLSLVFYVFLLASCSTNYIPSKTDNNNPHATSLEEQPSIFDNRCLHLLDIVERISILVEEEQKQIQKIKDKIPPDITPEQYEHILKSIEKTYNTQVQWVSDIYTKTAELLHTKLTIDNYLFFLLNLRFEYLHGREQAIQATLSLDGSELVNMLPTSKDFFDYLMGDSRFIKYQETNELARIYAVRRFELLNLLIKESVSICDKSELSRETIDLLCASIQLHPILDGKRQDLGNPDEACGPYGILEAIILGSNNKHVKSLQKSLNTTIILKTTEKLSPGDWRIIATKTVFKLIDTEEGELSKPMSAEALHHLNEIKKEVDVAVYQAHLMPKNQFIPFKNLGTPQGHGVYTSITDYEVGKWPYALPYPSFLTTKQHKVPAQLSPVYNAEKQIESKKDVAVVSQDYPKLKTSQLSPKEESVEDNNNSPSRVKIAKEDMATRKAADSSSLAIAPYGPDSPKEVVQEAYSTSTEDIEIVKEGKQEIKSVSNANSNSTALYGSIHPADQSTEVFNFIKDWVLPSGLRSFHSQMLRMIHPTRVLSAQYQSIVDSLFDNQQQGHVSYAEFQSLWKHIGGTIICGHGGSHRQLIGPQQEKMFGIFAHNNSQVYGPRYIKYLQTAVLYVGLRPTKGL